MQLRSKQLAVAMTESSLNVPDEILQMIVNLALDGEQADLTLSAQLQKLNHQSG